MAAMLPMTYQRWLRDWLPGEIPAESLATCNNCAMAAPPGISPVAAAQRTYFSLDKCCTYFPSLPNFQVGNVLRDVGEHLAEGKKRVRTRIENRIGIDPLCVRPDRRTAELYRIGSEVGFGRAEAFRCPYYVRDGGGSCSVWLHREAVCSTWYCKFDKPVKGREFWAALKILLQQLEITVAVHCALEKGISGRVVDTLLSLETNLRTVNDVDVQPDDELQARMWGEWLGREEQFYVEVSQLAEQIDLTEIRRLAGFGLQRRLDLVAKAYEELMTSTLPHRLRAASKLVISTAGPGSVHIQAGPFQPMQLPAAVVELLTHFRGQPVNEAMVALAEGGFEVEIDFLKKLFEYGFLVATDSSEAASDVGHPPPDRGLG